MRTGAAAGHTGYFHELALYESEDELVALVVPFVDDGVAAGEPTVVTLDDRNAAIVRDAVGEPEGVEFIAGGDQYQRPSSAIATYRDLLAGHVARGATQIRVVGDVPHPGTGVDWNPWLRYEATVNHALAGFPVWGLCPYDARITPPDVLADVERLHPRLAAPHGERRHNDRFEDPAAYLRRRCRLAPPAADWGPPVLSLFDVRVPLEVRAGVRAVAERTALPANRVDDLVIAASEVVANAIRHGATPVSVDLWVAGPASVICEVSDRGSGPSDPFVGLLPPAPESEGGYGLWMAHQVCDQVELHLGDDEFAVRLTVVDAA